MTAEIVAPRPVILIIEDVGSSQEVIEMSLRQLGADCHFAGNGVEGLELAS